MWALLILNWLPHGGISLTGITPMTSKEQCMQYRAVILKNLVKKEEEGADFKTTELVVCADISKSPVHLIGN